MGSEAEGAGREPRRAVRVRRMTRAQLGSELDAALGELRRGEAADAAERVRQVCWWMRGHAAELRG